MQNVASLSPSVGRLTQPSIPPWVGKISTWWMMAISTICTLQIGSLCQLGNQDMAAPGSRSERGWLLINE